MKKKVLFLFLLLTSVSFNLSAQKIISDQTNEKNLRAIFCNTEVCRNFTDRVVLSLGLSAFSDQKNLTEYSLIVSFSELNNGTNFSIPDSAILLIRTGDGSVLDLKCGKGDEDIFGKLSFAGDQLINMKTVTAFAKVTTEDIQHLSTGIIKVRCNIISTSITGGFYENQFKKPKLGKFLDSEMHLITNALQTSTNGDIKADF